VSQSGQRRLLGVAALAASCLAGGCAGCVDRGDRTAPGVLVVAESEQTSAFIRNFNPLVEVGDVRWPTRHAMYEPLLIFNPIDGKYVPWLAARWEWRDANMTLHFELRPGVRWSDGTPFTSKDVVYSFELLHTNAALDTRGIWKFLSAIRAVDDLTVEIRFARRYVPGLFYIAQQPLVPEHIWKEIADPLEFTNPNPVATGPFTEVSGFQPQAYQLGKNPHYWMSGKPDIDALRFMALPANDQESLALIRSEIDWAGSFMPAVDRIYVGKDPEHHHYWSPPIDGEVMLYANTTRKPWDDVRIRKALSMAIDRPLVVKVAMYGYTVPADATALSEAYNRYRSPAAVERGDWVRHDPEAAGKLLDEVGFKLGPDGLRHGPDGKVLGFQLGVPTGFSDWIRASQVMARGFRKLGIDATVDTVDFNAWFEALQQGNFDVYMGWTEPGPTPYALYRNLMATETLRPLGENAAENWHRFGLPEADLLLHGLEETADPAEEHRLTDQLQMLFVEHAPAIPLFPGPLWGEFSTKRFTGFPDAAHPYAPLSPHSGPHTLIVLTELKRR
jgi:peptide/nickel transport system substrate-binding protein